VVKMTKGLEKHSGSLNFSEVPLFYKYKAIITFSIARNVIMIGLSTATTPGGVAAVVYVIFC